MKEIILLGALAVLYKIGGRLFDRLDHSSKDLCRLGSLRMSLRKEIWKTVGK